MRILFLTQWYRPEPLTYQSDLAETLQQQGHEVTVVTGFPNWPSGELVPGYKIRIWQRETIGGVSIIRVPLFPDHSKSAFRRASNFCSFAAASSTIAPWLTPTYDLVHCNFPPVTLGFPAWLLSRLRRVPLTFEVQDLWPETLAATGMMNRRAVLSLVDRIARWGYRRAAAIRVISPGFRDNLVAKGVPAERVHVISNWVDTERYRPCEADSALGRELGIDGRMNIMYAGTIGAAQGLENLIEAAEALSDQPQLQFVLVGDGTDLPRLREIVASRNIGNVKFFGRVSPEQMAKIYPFASILFMAVRDDPLFRITIPHKVFAYMSNAKPIIAAAEGDLADVVRESNAGLTCPPGNSAALIETIRRLMALPANERERMGANGRRTVIEHYNRDLLVRRVAAMFEQAIAGRIRPSMSAEA